MKTMKLGFIVPNFPNEKRVALLPQHIEDFENQLYVETGFGASLGITDEEYASKGCTILDRSEIYKKCDAIFNLKLTQPSDYKYLKSGQMILGWTHPFGSGADFYNGIAKDLKLKIVDLDNIYPRVFHNGIIRNINFIPKNFVWKNSFNAGYASTQHALLSFGLVPDSNTKIAVLASGSVSQGAYYVASKYGSDVRMFYRKTMNEFYDSIDSFDIIINGIEVDNDNDHIISSRDLDLLKKNTLIIDAAADAGRAIYGTKYTSIDNPIYKENELYFYVVNNAPSIIYRKSSFDISKSFSNWVYKYDVKRFGDLLGAIK